MSESSSPLKVLFLTACSGKGGAGRSLYLICRYLDRTLVDPLVVMPEQGSIGAGLKALGIPVILPHHLRERTFQLRFSRATPLTRVLSFFLNIWDSARFSLELAGIVRQEKVDAIYSNHMMVKIMGVLAGLLTRRPVILHTRTVYGRMERFLYLAFAALPHVRRIIAVSDAAAGNFREIAHKVRVVRNGMPVEEVPLEDPGGRLRREVSVGEGRALVGFAGRLVKRKGIDVFLQAARELLERRDDVAFVVLGDVPVGSTHATLESYRVQARDQGLEERICFLGFKEDAVPYIRDLQVLVVPSVSPDPCPRVVLEGMAVGTPVVGSAVGGIREILTHDLTGLLVSPGRPRDIADQVERVLDQPTLARDLARRARRTVEEEFAARDVSRRIQRHLAEALLPASTGSASSGG